MLYFWERYGLELRMCVEMYEGMILHSDLVLHEVGLGRFGGKQPLRTS